MEPLRWILLAAGIAFVLIIYVLGRSRRRRNQSIVDTLEGDNDGTQDDLPEFSAANLDDMDEGVGAVRIITGTESNQDEFTSVSLSATDNDSAEDNVFSETAAANREAKSDAGSSSKSSRMPDDIIVLFILPKADQLLLGSQLNSAAQAMGLSFGEMNIFHYKANGRNVFSLANMLEPGSFDADTIHDMKTSGLTVFMQITGDDPLDDLTEMLQRSYQLAGLLDARLCNHKRQPLTEQDAENYRQQVRAFSPHETAELSSET